MLTSFANHIGWYLFSTPGRLIDMKDESFIDFRNDCGGIMHKASFKLPLDPITNVRLLVNKVLAISSSNKQFASSRDFLVVSLPESIGYEIFKFSISKGKSISENIVFDSKASCKNKICRLILSFKEENDGLFNRIISFTLHAGSKGISKERLESVVRIVEENFKKQAREVILLIESRRQLLNQVSEASKKHRECSNKQKLDKLINPDKYKNSSPTVRRVREGGSNRYMPATRSRNEQTTRSRLL